MHLITNDHLLPKIVLRFGFWTEAYSLATIVESVAFFTGIASNQNELCTLEWSKGCALEQHRLDQTFAVCFSALFLFIPDRPCCFFWTPEFFKWFIVFFNTVLFTFFFSKHVEFAQLRSYFRCTAEQFKRILLMCTVPWQTSP